MAAEAVASAVAAEAVASAAAAEAVASAVAAEAEASAAVTEEAMAVTEADADNRPPTSNTNIQYRYQF